jgi:hypothetical protein
MITKKLILLSFVIFLCVNAFAQIIPPTNVWTPAGGNIYFNGGNVGIGLSSPLYPLHVNGNASITKGLSARSVTTSFLKTDTLQTGIINVPTGINNLKIGGGAIFNGNLFSNSLTVFGLAHSSGIAELFVDTTGNLTIARPINPASYPSCTSTNPAWRIGGNTVGSRAGANIGTCDNYDFILKANDTPYLWLKPDGKLGIGNSNPSYQLDVTGNARITGTLTASAINITQAISSPRLVTNRIISPDSNGIHFGDSSIVMAYPSPIHVNSVTGNPVQFDQLYSNLGGPSGGRLAIGAAWALGNPSIAIGTNSTNPTKANGANSIAIGMSGTAADALGSTAIGYNVKVGSNGTKSFAIGSGIGINNTTALTNNTANSLAVGFNSDIPTFFVGGGSGVSGSLGKVGIGTTSPAAPLHVNSISTVSSDPAFLVTNFTSGFSLFDVQNDGNVIINDGDPSFNGPLLSLNHSGGGSLQFMHNGVGDILSSVGIRPTAEYGFDFTVLEGHSGTEQLRLMLPSGGGALIQTNHSTPGGDALVIYSSNVPPGNSASTSTYGSSIFGGPRVFIVKDDGNITSAALASTTGTTRSLLVDGTGKLIPGPASGAAGSAWALGGNDLTGTSFPNNAFGTTDANSDLVFITGGTANTNVDMFIRHQTGDLVLNHKQLIFTGAADPSHGVGVFPSTVLFSTANGTTFNINGPILYGWDGGALGSNQTLTFGGISRVALRWNNAGQVVVGGGIPQGNHANAVFAVFGKTLLTEAYVNISTAVWADYVFEKNYNLMPLSEVEKYYLKNKHLPDVPSAKEMETKGDNVAETDAMLLKKIEELTIHMVELEKQVKELKKANK